jgi:hypothetical protein
MGRNWGGDDRRVQAVYVVNESTVLSRLRHADGELSLLVGDHLVLRMTPAGAVRVVRLIQAAGL